MTTNRKPKRQQAGDLEASSPYDRCQTPPYALDPLLPYLSPDWVIWESAAGDGVLAEAMRDSGLTVLDTDILTGTNFFKNYPGPWHAQVTNPPYSIKYQWLERSYELCKPFALLVPLETLGAAAAQVLFRKHGCEVIFMDKRVDFKMPDHTWAESSAQFPVIWLTWGLGIGREMTFVRLHKPTAQQRAELDAGVQQLEMAL